jgi:hypothetical protein
MIVLELMRWKRDEGRGQEETYSLIPCPLLPITIKSNYYTPAVFIPDKGRIGRGAGGGEHA